MILKVTLIPSRDFRTCYCLRFSKTRIMKGHLTNKSQLPVTKINFGGLGQPSSQSREAKFQLGPLYCSGADPGDHGYADRKYGPSPASCKDLWLRGQKQVNINRYKVQS